MDNMLNDRTRAKVIPIWSAAVVMVVVCGVVLGVSVTASTAAVLVVLSVIAPAIVLRLWPRAQPPTVAEVLHGVDRRV
jgi:hypothetical protein